MLKYKKTTARYQRIDMINVDDILYKKMFDKKNYISGVNNEALNSINTDVFQTLVISLDVISMCNCNLVI